MLRTCVLLSVVAMACSQRPEARTPDRPENAQGAPAAPQPEASGDVCRGEPTSGTERELVSRAEQVQGCYDALLRRDRSRQGRVVVGLRIRTNGEIAAAGLVKDELHDPDFETCALERFSLPFRNPPTGGCLQVEVPIRFAPKPGGT
jgi:hypothetical protein